MNRRGFLKALLAVIAAPFLPKPKPSDFSRAVFTVAPHVSEEVGISIRHIRMWDGRAGRWVNRMDILYGNPLLCGSTEVRVRDRTNVARTQALGVPYHTYADHKLPQRKRKRSLEE